MKDQLAYFQQITEKRYRQFAEWHRAMKELAAEYAMPAPDPAILRAAADRLKGWADAFPEQREGWSALEAGIRQRYEDMSLRYEGLLRERCAAAGYTIAGRSPELTVESMVKVQIDPSQNQARVNGKRVSPMAVARVMDEIAAEVERLWGRPFDAADFLARLRAAHEAAGGGPTPARAVYEAMTAADNTYKFDMFAADLARLTESGLLQAQTGAQMIYRHIWILQVASSIEPAIYQGHMLRMWQVQWVVQALSMNCLKAMHQRQQF